jgi:hypothetical protein
VNGEAITREIAEAGVGVGRLIRYDPRWPDGFNPSAAGFVRSFLGPLFGLPFNLMASALIARASPGPMHNLLWVAAASHIASALAFPALVAAIARPLKVGEGYAGFIIIYNWASLFVNVLTAAVSLLILTGDLGYDVFTTIWLLLFGVSLFVVWRAACETLSPDIPIALLMVVLSVAVGVLTDQVASFAFGVPLPG